MYYVVVLGVVFFGDVWFLFYYELDVEVVGCCWFVYCLGYYWWYFVEYWWDFWCCFVWWVCCVFLFGMGVGVVYVVYCCFVCVVFVECWVVWCGFVVGIVDWVLC